MPLGEGPGGVRPSVVTCEENVTGSDSELAAAGEREMWHKELPGDSGGRGTCGVRTAGCNSFRAAVGIFFRYIRAISLHLLDLLTIYLVLQQL